MKGASGVTTLHGVALNPVKPVAFGIVSGIEINLLGPVFIRRREDRSGIFELSTLPASHSYNEVKAESVAIYPSATTAAHLARWSQALEGDAEAQNMVGMSISFAHNTEQGRKAGYFPNNCDWDAALYWFEKSAAQGYWAAQNNIGVMFLNGHGVPRDNDRAFELFTAAAASNEPVPLRHLADCYGSGDGCTQDLERARVLREIAARVIAERDTAAKSKS